MPVSDPAVVDDFDSTQPDLQSPACDAFAITPSDTDNLKQVTRALYIGGVGDVKVMMKYGGVVTFKAVPVASFLPIRVKKVFSTGTTATLILGLF